MKSDRLLGPSSLTSDFPLSLKVIAIPGKPPTYSQHIRVKKMLFIFESFNFCSLNILCVPSPQLKRYLTITKNLKCIVRNWMLTMMALDKIWIIGYLFLNPVHLPTFFESNVWDFCLVIDGISENVPVTSEDFRRFSEGFRMFPNTSKDAPTKIDHFQSHIKDNNLSALWFRWDTKSSFNALLEHFWGSLIEFSLLIMC